MRGPALGLWMQNLENIATGCPQQSVCTSSAMAAPEVRSS
jgi:hypothetical protein